MANFFIALVSMVPLMAVLDLVWLGVVMKDFYRANLGHLMGEVVWFPAVIFYFLYTAGLAYFAVLPAHESDSLLKAVLLGAMLGLFAYGTYDLTNHATLRDWPLIVTVLDMVWGAVISGVVAGGGYFALKYFM